MKSKGKSSVYDCIRPVPVSPSTVRDVMAGPVSNFVPVNGAPRSLLLKPTKLGLGTKLSY